MTVYQHRRTVGFTLHTRTSATIPGAWGVLALIWEPAAYAESLFVARHPKSRET